jgi:tellurite resistance protein TerC
MSSAVFPIGEYWWLYLAFTGLIAALLAFDLVLHRTPHPMSFREAAFWTGLWITVAAGFACLLYGFASITLSPAAAHRLTLEFLAGYLVEESLSVDNMFVFALIFRHFAVPPGYQHRVLFYGIVGAMAFRALFVGVGAALIRFEVVVSLFGLFLILTGARMAFGKEKQIEPARSPIVRLARRFLPVSAELHAGRFFVKLDGAWHITPLLIVLLLLETTDILFAVDSVPAVFGVTREPFIVYTSNVLAILGLRALYFLLAGAMERFYALKYGLAVALVFVGLKMVWLDRLFGARFPIGVSLAVIVGILAVSILLSLVYPQGAGQNKLLLWPEMTWAVPRLVGVGCLLLGCACVLVTAGLFPFPLCEPASQESLYQTAACYFFCGVLLIRSSAGHRQSRKM